MKNGGLISFCGPDGVGKSTQVRLLIRYLKSRGFRVRFAWIRTPHMLTYFVTRIFQRLGYPSIPLRTRFSEIVLLLLEIPSIILKLITTTYLPLKRGYLIVAERHILDTIVGLAVFFFKNPRFILSHTALLFLRFIPRRSLFMYLDASSETIISRRIKRSARWDRRLANPFIRNYVLKRIPIEKALYRILVKATNGAIIDVNGEGILEVHRQVMTILRNSKFLGSQVV